MRYLFLLLFVYPLNLAAQTTMSGKVLSLVNQKPVADASVFLNNTSIGTKTDAAGTFTLSNVKNGKYDLIVSCVGFEAVSQGVVVQDNKVQVPDIQLMPKVTELREVKIGKKNTRVDSRRARLLRMFMQEFLGNTANASQTKILNPEILYLDYDEEQQKLTASTQDFLIIENKALGYRTKYLLTSFVKDPLNNILQYTGASAFEQIKGTPEQQTEWQNKRVKTYLGSAMHFLRACTENAVGQNDFTVFKLQRTPNPDRAPDSVILRKIRYFTDVKERDSAIYWSTMFQEPRFAYSVPKVKLDAKEYIKATDQKSFFALYHPNILMVNYKNNNANANANSTLIIFGDQETYFDSNGIILSMRDNKFERYWSELRFADQLPADYELPRSLK
ncbi:carboxypeptidase-like regulatory domain-containing protein [Mucilaginibacter myungsuensis]|uniref:Carboxypeptidase-like regulatory domain-containing protein n=1 Tax=Mucilaginibacter myungsuensis TaxID=649104 RepID=A0A929KZU9_9SPHI|nr:carboxypeptidase-like regulatory domain-containing protein [Mucilaginibacter myungsuensis]MBE9664242.1 carboxypeptidase-like regulatory domain-containing protein [Mucilaginibacter myungsuensis]MDN3599946.1 carboxypeptidase-like regulatory domain-containing protein [Mucilaginibacter myungsuensis]